LSDLRVTDLQKIIRGYIDTGHDITKSPYQVHIDNKPYGMVIHHQLTLEKNNSVLTTYAMQAERPVVSRLTTESTSSVIPNPKSPLKSGERPIGRSVRALSRHMRVSDQHPTSHSYDDLTWQDTHLPHLNIKDWAGDHGEYLNNNGLWIPHAYSHYKDSHEALQSHTSAEISHAGVLHTRNSNNESSDQSKSVRERFGPRPREMTPEEHSSFNNTEAFHDLAEVKPFAGLVHVESYGTETRGNYTYNPQTEELHRHE